jgi:hypothetical protein
VEEIHIIDRIFFLTTDIKIKKKFFFGGSQWIFGGRTVDPHKLEYNIQ